MNSQEKIEHFWNEITEKARINPSSGFHIDIVSFVDMEVAGGMPEASRVIISPEEKWAMLWKWDEEGWIEVLETDTDWRGAWMKILKNSAEEDRENAQKIAVKGGTLYINKDTGYVALNHVGERINPSSKEFKILHNLASKPVNQVVTYEAIISERGKNQQRDLGYRVRNLKEYLGILPKTEQVNEDIIQNIKKRGYRLLPPENFAHNKSQ